MPAGDGSDNRARLPVGEDGGSDELGLSVGAEASCGGRAASVPGVCMRKDCWRGAVAAIQFVSKEKKIRMATRKKWLSFQNASLR